MTIIYNSSIYSQINPDFSVSVTNGCAPLLVQISDQSTGLTPTFRKYVLGNGNQVDQAPASVFASYTQPGYYSITLIVANGLDTFQITKDSIIQVFNNPVVDFELKNEIPCGSKQVCFRSLSSSEAGLSLLQWDFGDGAFASNDSVPCHTYGQLGTYTINLLAVDSNGCQNFSTKTNFVVLNPKPTANFTATGNQLCFSRSMVQFTNTSTSTTNYTSKWQFGDGANSTLKNPRHLYLNGVYDVQLKIENAVGCADSITKPAFVKITDPVAQFTTSKDTFCLGEEVKIANTSFAADSVVWYINNDTLTTQDSAKFFALSGGPQPITIAAFSDYNCVSSFTDTIFIQDFVADFYATDTVLCALTDTAELFATANFSIGSVFWVLQKNNGFDTTSTNPALYKPQAQGFFTDSLFATSTAGCLDTVAKPDFLHLAVPEVYADPPGVQFPALGTVATIGCVPFTTQLTPQAYYYTSISSVAWDFGDGTTSTQIAPTHTFLTDSLNYVTATVTFQNGCTALLEKLLALGTVPVPQVDIAPVGIPHEFCGSEDIQFIDQSQNLLTNDQFLWSFSSGDETAERNPFIKITDTGFVNLNFVVGYFGCYNNLQVDSFLRILPPIAYAEDSIDCSDEFTHYFSADYKGVDRFYWNFGDGSPLDSVNPNPTHVYAQPGTYQVILSSFNDSTLCDFHDTIEVYALPHQAILSTDKSIYCKLDTVHIKSNQSTGNVDFRTRYYLGVNQIGGAADSLDYKILTKGTQTITLITTNHYACRDTAQTIIKVFEPVPSFSISTLNNCIPAQYQFNDQSLFDTTAFAYQYNLSNNTSYSTPNPLVTVNQPANQNVSVQYTVTDILGCSKTINVTNQINAQQPPTYFDWNPDSIFCNGQNLSVKNIPVQSGFQYSWNFMNGDSSVGVQPNYGYVSGGPQSTALTIVDAQGCDSTFVRSLFVIQNSGLNFTASDSTISCIPKLVSFTNTSTPAIPITRLFWQFDSQHAFVAGGNTVFHTYNDTGDFTVKMVAVNNFGCRDTVVKTGLIAVDAPKATFATNNSAYCRNEPIEFILSLNNRVASYTLDFGDGTINQTTNDTLIHQYTNRGTITPTLLYADSSNTCVNFFSKQLLINELNANFSLKNDTINCVPYELITSNNSVNAHVWNWYFQNQIISSSNSIDTVVTAPGTYLFELIVNDTIANCADTASKSIRLVNEPITFQTADTVICEGDSVEIGIQTADAYSWQPAEFASTPNSSNTLVYPSISTNFVANLRVDSINCDFIRSVKVDVVNQFEVNASYPQIIEVQDTLLAYAIVPDYVVPSWFLGPTEICNACDTLKRYAVHSETITLYGTDTLGCFTNSYEFTYYVDQRFSVDVPQAFTPNNDGRNDVVFVRGRGIEQLLEFSVYNRSGQRVFYTNDLNEGFTGIVNGEVLPTDTYAYVVVVEFSNGKTEQLKGTISLLN